MGTSQSKTKKKFKKILEEKVLERIYPSPNTQIIKTKSKRPTKAAPQTQNVQSISLHARPVEDKNEAKVNAVDGRKQVQNTTEWPYSVHGVVASKFQNVTCWGTGTLIGPHIVLTAGHNLYDFEHKTYADVKSLQFLPGMNGQMLPFGLIKVKKYFVSPNYIKEKKEDYGILILKEPIGEMTGYFGLACLDPEEIKKKKINITGYPSDKVSSKPGTYEMWGMEGEASSIDQDKGLINYLIDTETGQSGSGVWYQEKDDYYVCGVHVSGNSLVNIATLLTQAIYKQIYEWVQQGDHRELVFTLGDMKELRFESQKINKGSLSLLMKYKLDDLTSLRLFGNKIGNKGAKVLARNTSWINLSHFSLRANNIGAEGAKILSQNNFWINLSKLDLCGNNIGPEGAKAIAQNISWTSLSDLYLSANNIGSEGAKMLAQNTSWASLSRLDLFKNNIGPEGAKALAQNTSWTSLSKLYFTDNRIGNEGAKALAQNTSWTNLSKLSLTGNNINAEGARVLAQNTSWVNLSIFYLSHNQIGDKGAKALAQNTSWTKLSWINLDQNSISVAGFFALKQNQTWEESICIQL